MTRPVSTSPAPPRLLWFARVLLACLRRDLAETSRYRLAFLSRVAALALAALSLYFFARFVGAQQNRHLNPYGGDYLTFGMIGLVAAQLQHVGVTTLAHRVRTAQLAGFLEAQLATPAPAWMVLGAAPTYVFLGALVQTVGLVVAGWLVFDLQLRPNFGTLALGIPLSALAFAGLGLLGGAATMITRRTNPVTVLMTATSALLSGVLYPVSVLPGWLRQAAELLPLTHALEVGRRGLLTGAWPSEVARSLVALAMFAALLSLAGLVSFAWALRRARVDGSLTHF
jgi:ABC-2 type transport system permease protein